MSEPVGRTPGGAPADRPGWYVTLFAGPYGIATEVWCGTEGVLAAELAVCRKRIDDPGDYSTRMAVTGDPLPPWASTDGYTTPRDKTGVLSPVEKRLGRPLTRAERRMRGGQ